jgi:hypothetical protein
MALKMSKQAAIPDGAHTGAISGARETTKVFDQEKGPEEVVEITIRPDWKDENGGATLPVSVVFSPSLNGLSALSKLLERLDIQVPDGANWTPHELVGRKVTFVAERTKGGFVRVLKDSIKAV